MNVNSGGAREKSGMDNEHNYRNTQKARRSRIRQLCTMNFDSNSKFVTLTFDNVRDFDISNVKACNSYFHDFIRRLKYRYPNLIYLAVIEFQDKNNRGAVHYHLLCNLPYIKKSELQDIWGAGFVKINKIDKVDNIGAYVTKYMNKDLDDKRLCGLKAYQHSRNLIEPLCYTSWNTPSDTSQLLSDLANKKPSYEATYESENAGRVTYTQYNLLR